MFQALSDQDSGYGEISDPPMSLWRMVEDQAPPSERAEIRRILGEAAVDLSLDLHAEVEVLLELCREIRSASPSSLQGPPSSCSVLADPPVIKDMVTQEIRMLLLSVRRKARQQGLDEDQALTKYSPKVVTYVMGPGGPESRARSAESIQGRPASASRAGGERPLSSLSTGSSLEDDLEELKDKLRISDIDEVVQHLRSLLEEECQTLKKDITYLQQHIEEDFLYIREIHSPLPEPSLTELKEERRIIERDLQQDQRLGTPGQSPSKRAQDSSLDDARRDSLEDLYAESRLYKPRPPHRNLDPPAWKTQEVLRSPLLVSPIRSPDRIPSNHPPGSLQHIPSRGARLSPISGVPASRSQSSHGVMPPDTVFVPTPPPAHRPAGGANSVPAFRRVRAKVANMPP